MNVVVVVVVMVAGFNVCRQNVDRYKPESDKNKLRKIHFRHFFHKSALKVILFCCMFHFLKKDLFGIHNFLLQS